MSDAVEAVLTGFSANAKGERRLSFCIHKDDAHKVSALADLIGHSFGLALARIDGSQPAQEDQRVLTTAQPASATQPTELRPARAPLNKLTQLAGILSHDKQFHRYAQERWPFVWKAISGDDKVRAAEVIRQCCQVKSRKELLPGTSEGDEFLSLYDSFSVWRDAPRHGIEA